MATLTSPLKISRSGLARPDAAGTKAEGEHTASKPHLISARNNTSLSDLRLRMYTEEQVAELLQVSLSKLRKWRMKKNTKSEKGPPFRKIGRLVRYPEAGLDVYVNGE